MLAAPTRRWYNFYDVTTPREAQLYIEVAVERGLDIPEVRDLAQQTYENVIRRDSRKGAWLVLKELDRQERAGSPKARAFLALGLMIVMYAVLMMVYVLH